jgi:hypothetical protein
MQPEGATPGGTRFIAKDTTPFLDSGDTGTDTVKVSVPMPFEERGRIAKKEIPSGKQINNVNIPNSIKGVRTCIRALTCSRFIDFRLNV